MLIEMNKRKLYNKIINHFGKEKQLFVVFEELSELQKAISKYERENNEHNLNDIMEEIADVQIMIEQLYVIYQLSNKKVDLIKLEKLYKLKKWFLNIQEKKRQNG